MARDDDQQTILEALGRGGTGAPEEPASTAPPFVPSNDPLAGQSRFVPIGLMADEDPAALQSAYLREQALARQQTSLLQGLQPGGGETYFTPGGSVGQPLESGGRAPFNVPPRQQPAPEPGPSGGQRFLMGLAYGLAGVGREYLMDQYRQQNEGKYLQMELNRQALGSL